MARMILMRVGQGILSLFSVIVFVFFLVRLTGNPAYFLLGLEAQPADYARVTKELKLDEPWYSQFWLYIEKLLHGDLGTSYRLHGSSVLDLIVSRLPATLMLGFGALVLVMVIAIPLGVYSAYWQGGIIDRIARFVAALGQSVPSFWFGLLLILLFAVQLGILPSGGYRTPQDLILPCFTLAVEPIARLTRLLRSSMLEELGSEHVKFLRIKGVPERTILWKHALRNAGLTSLTFVGVLAISLLNGSVLVETVFVWPGIGRLMVESIHYRDFAIVQGLVLLIAAGFIVGTLIIDLLYMVLNPRLRLSGQK
jgi:peptide/nickel transport system permease protein